MMFIVCVFAAFATTTRLLNMEYTHTNVLFIMIFMMYAAYWLFALFGYFDKKGDNETIKN